MEEVDRSWHLLICYLFVVVGAVVLFFSSCTTTKYVEVEKAHDVYHHSVDTIRDSIYHDVFVNQYIKGDTVYKERVETEYKWLWRTMFDTLRVTDSVPKPYPVEKIVKVEKELSFLQKVRLWAGDIFLALIGVGGLVFLVVRYCKK